MSIQGRHVDGEAQPVVLKSLGMALARSAKSGVPLIAIHETDLNQLPSGLLEDLQGLAAVQPVRGDDGKLRLLAFWSTADDARIGEPVLQARLSSAASPLSGLAAEPVTKPSGLIERVKEHAVPILLSTVAVIGAVEALGNRYDTLIATPQFTVRFDETDYDIDEGSGSFAPSVIVENALAGVQLSNIVITPSLSAPADGLPPERIAAVDPPGTSLPATKSRAYQLEADRLHPGDRGLLVAVTANAGKLRDEVQVQARARVTVWPVVPKASVQLRQTRHNRADFTWTFVVGSLEESSSVRCDLRLEGAALKVAGGGFWRPVGGGSSATWDALDDIVRLQATWTATKARSRHFAEFSLEGAAGTDWNVIAKTKPTCSLVRP
jgi:hypothetical protein